MFILFIKSLNLGEESIACQSPLNETIEDFFQMIFENEKWTILILLNNKGKNESLEAYWPTDLNRPLIHGSFELKMIEEFTNEHFIKRILILKKVELDINRFSEGI